MFELDADASLRYEVGSITKTFTGLLLAEMAGRGEVAFEDPAGKYLRSRFPFRAKTRDRSLSRTSPRIRPVFLVCRRTWPRGRIP